MDKEGMSMASRSSIAQSTLLLTLANLAMRGVSMLFQVYLTGQIGAAGIGLLQLILTVNCFAITLGTSGLRVAAMYLSAEEYGLQRFEGIRQAMIWCMGIGTLFSMLVGGIMTFLAEPLAQTMVKDLRAAASLRLLGLTLPLTCLGAILSGYFTASNQVKKLVAVEIADRIASVGLTVWLLKMGVPGDQSHACVAIVGGGALASLGSAVVLFAMMLSDFRRCGSPKEHLGMGRRLVRISVPVALNDYLRSGLGTMEQFLIPYGLARWGGSRNKAMADYGTIQGMVFPILLLPSTILYAVADLLVPELARCRAQKNQQRIRHLAETCLHMGVLFSAMTGGLLYVLAEPLGFLLYKSPEAGRYLQWFAPLIPMLYLDCIVDGMHKGMGQQVYCVRVNTLTNLMDVVLLFLMLPRYGITGYYFTYLFTHLVNFCLSLLRLLKLTGANPGGPFLVTTAGTVCLCVWFTRHFVPSAPRLGSLLISGSIFLTLTASLLVLFGCWKQKDGQYLLDMFLHRRA